MGFGAVGFLAQMGVKDFAGGIVVHTTAGVAALVIAIVLGKREKFHEKFSKPPHSPVITMIGACMLWVGWFGFNGGSALAADANAGMAMTVTHISAATASLVWMFIEWLNMETYFSWNGNWVYCRPSYYYTCFRICRTNRSISNWYSCCSRSGCL